MRPRPRARLVNVAGALSLAAIGVAQMGCRQVLEGEGYRFVRSPGAGGGAAGDAATQDASKVTYSGKCDDVEYASASCRDCVGASCCAAATACSQEPACAAMAQCLARCAPDDSACRGTCRVGIPSSPPFSALVACEAASCPSCASSAAVFGNGKCDRCLADKCQDPLSLLSSSAAAQDARACQRACTDQIAGFTGCSCPAAPTEVTALLGCATGRCNDCAPLVDWSCLGSVQWPRPAPSLRTLELHVGVTTALNFQTVLDGATLRACGLLDTACLTPLKVAPAGERSVTTVQGRATLSIDATIGDTFFGFVEATWTGKADPSASSDDRLDALLYWFPPPRSSPTYSWRRAVTRAQAQTTVTPLGITLDWSSRGGIVWSTASCDGAPAPGVHVELGSAGPDERIYYFGETPLLDPDAGATSSLGFGFAVNVQPGTRRLVATLADGRRVGTYEVVVRRGFITHLTITPAPDSG